jgi:hypothetical protein
MTCSELPKQANELLSKSRLTCSELANLIMLLIAPCAIAPGRVLSLLLVFLSSYLQ